MKRLLAVLAAVAMVGGAWWFRQHVIDGGDGDGGGGGDELRLLCGSDLAEVCRELADQDDSIRLTVVQEGATTDQLSADDARATFDAWLTAGPWARIVDDNRRSRGASGSDPLGGTSEVLGRSPVSFVGPSDRIGALSAHCGGTVSWVCLGDVSGQDWSAIGGSATWGQVKAGLAPPETGAGLVALDQAVAAEVGRTGWDTLDLEDAAPWLDRLVGSAWVGADPFDELRVRPGSFSVAAPLLQQAGPRLDRAAGGSTSSLLYPEPVVTADVTLNAAAGIDVGDVLERISGDRLADALAAHGWQATGRPDAPGTDGGPPLPDDADLASPGALQALRERWRG